MKSLILKRKKESMQKQGEVEKKLFVLAVLLIITILIASFVSADLLDWFKRTITGRASTGTTDVSISISGANAVTIDFVWNDSLSGSSMNPTEGGTTTIEFNVTITDSDGVADINDTSVKAELINGTITRVNDTCADLGQDTTNSANYSCSIDLYYFDTTGPWIINITANDLGNKNYISNYSETFFYPVLQAIQITPTSLTWPSVSGTDENKTSDNDPTYINNSGNYNATGAIAVQGINLYGASGNFIDVGNITAATVTGDSCSGAACIECNTAATNVFVLANGSDTTVSSIVLEAGNLTNDAQNNVVANATLWYCLVLVPSGLASESYSTQNSGSSAWIIKYV